MRRNEPDKTPPADEDIELTSADAISAARAAFDRLRHATAVREHLAAALALLERPEDVLSETAC